MSEEKTDMSAFNVTTLSNDGVKVPLSLPDGTPTEEFLVVCGADSKEFKTHKMNADRRKLQAVKDLKDNPERLAELHEDINRELVATLVKSWSFEPECNVKNVCAFLESAPQVQTQVDKFAGDRSNFFTKPPKG